MEKSKSKLDVSVLTLAISFIFGFICCAIFSNIAYNRMIERVKLLETRNANLKMMVDIMAPLELKDTSGNDLNLNPATRKLLMDTVAEINRNRKHK